MKRGYDQKLKVDYSTHECFEDDVALGRQIQEGDQRAMVALQLKHLRFVARSAAVLAVQTRSSFQDLFQEGAIGLNKAVRNYDPELGYRLLTYGGRIIYQHLNAYVQANSRAISIPNFVRDEMRSMIPFVLEFEEENNRRPNVGEVMIRFDIKKGRAKGLLERYEITMNRSSSLGIEQDVSTELTDDNLTEGLEEEIARQQFKELCRKKIFAKYKGNSKMKERAWAVFEGIFGFNEKMEFLMQKELATQFGVSGTLIGFIVRDIIDLLRSDEEIVKALRDLIE